MKAWIIESIHPFTEDRDPLTFCEFPVPVPGPSEVLIKIKTCGICHTEIDEIEGRTPPPVLPVIPGHQVVGNIFSRGKNAQKFKEGDRVGVSWIYSSCGQCTYCLNGLENLCPEFKATGRDFHGGYAEFMTIHEDFCFPIPASFSDSLAAPLFCAGSIGYRSLKLAGLKNGMRLGLSGFGASAHLVLKMARYLYPDSEIFVFARSEKERDFALQLGASRAMGYDSDRPSGLDAVIDTTPAWKPVIRSLENLNPGGRLVINAIRKEQGDIASLQSLDYARHLWMEREIKSIANITRQDVIEFLRLADEIKIKPEIEEYHFHKANNALIELKQGKIRGAKILMMN